MHQELLAWFDIAKRDLPWRRTSDPYAIWVSEIMLQQTQVATVVPYFQRWLARFPTVESLADADEQEVLAHWQGLGYYRRCRYLHQGARWVVEHGMPRTRDEWLNVPGVGKYTAGAVASIALGEAVPVVDGNVERVYSRLTASESPDGAWAWAEKVLAHDRPGDWNQALMELGATVCRPIRPDCENCPLSGDCAAYLQGQVELYPKPEPRPTTKKLTHVVWVPTYGGEYGLRQIPDGVWWHGMWEFPRVERVGDWETQLRSVVGEGWVREVGHFTHTVTHHRIRLDVAVVECETQSANLLWVSPNELAAIPMPAPQRKALALAIA